MKLSLIFSLIKTFFPPTSVYDMLLSLQTI